jgi:uncharacterized membrane protein YeaQ/YmgE (transglycosylase-associated protein family)
MRSSEQSSLGFVAGVIAKLLTPGDNEPWGFPLTTLLEIVGAFCRDFWDRLLPEMRESANAGSKGWLPQNVARKFAEYNCS